MRLRARGTPPFGWQFPPEYSYTPPAFEKAISRTVNREGIADHFEDLMVAGSIQVDGIMPDSLHQQLLFVEKQIKEQARHHDPVAAQLLQTIPGIGKTLGLTILYEIGDVSRFSSVGQFISYARLMK
jgi:transposase